MKRRLILSAVCMIASMMMYGQVNTFSPLTRLGFGDIQDPYYMHMRYSGGLGAAFKSMQQTNIANPASYGSIRTTIYDVGWSGQSTTISDQTNEVSGLTGNIGYLSMAFPLQNSINAALERVERDFNWGLGLSLMPFSGVGYEIETNTYREATDDYIIRNYVGDGGSYRAVISNGFSYKNLSFGFNFNVMFGQARYDRQISLSVLNDDGEFEFQSETYLDNYRDRISYSGIFFDFGVQYDFVLNRITRADGSPGIPDKFITLGATIRPQKEMKAEGELLHSTRFISILPTPTNVWGDTILNEASVKGNFTLPTSISLGLAYTELNKIKFGVNFTADQWSNYKNALKPEPTALMNSWSVSGGVSYTPDAFNPRKLLRRMTYSLGIFYDNDPRSLNGDQVTDLGVSLGFGLPIFSARQEFPSHVTIGLLYGQRGVNDVLTENYFNIGIGAALTDSGWFRKRKYF